ncbi:MAG: hypothetical protein QM811_29850 [Pirellulales bacterium]
MSAADLLKLPYRLAKSAWQSLPLSRESRGLKKSARRAEPTGTQHRVVARSSTDRRRIAQRGISIVGFDELFGAQAAETLPGLRTAVDGFVNGDYVRDEAANYVKNFATMSGKDYVIRHYRKQRARRGDDPIFALGLRDELLNPVNAYAGMWMTYRGNDVWYTVPVNVERERKTSQNWHRDYEDEKLVKVFLYCSEVTPRTGPFEYVPYSRRGEKYLLNPALASGVIKDGFYPEPETVDATIPESARSSSARARHIRSCFATPAGCIAAGSPTTPRGSWRRGCT